MILWRFEIHDATLSVSQTLTDEPVGWADIMFKLVRDGEWHGISFDFTANSLQFYGDGRDILRNAYAYAGIDASSELWIYQKCDDMDEELAYQGSFLYPKYKEDFNIEEGVYITMDIENIGAIMTFKNRYDQKVDLDTANSYDGVSLTPYAGLGQTISLPSKGIIKQDDYRVSGGIQSISWVESVSGAGDFAYKFTIPYNKAVLEEFKVNPSDSSSAPIFITPIFTKFPFSVSVPTMITIAEGGSYTFDVYTVFNIDIDTTGTGALVDNVVLELWYSVNGVETRIDFTTNTNSVFATHFIWNDSLAVRNYLFTLVPLVLSLNKGDIVNWYLKVNINTSGGTFSCPVTFGVNGFYIKYSALTHFSPSDCKVYLVNEVLSRITEAITNDELRVYSDYYGRTDAEPYTSVDDGCGSLRVLTKGLFIRQALPGGNNPIFTLSMKQCYEALDSIDCIGMGYEDDPNRAGYKMIRVEPFDYFYNNNVILTCLNIPKITFDVNTERCFSIFKSGYSKYESEEFNGIDEFLSSRDYRFETKSVKATLDKVCDFIASGYAIEVTRRKNINTKDWRYDNDTFIICVRRDGLYYTEWAVELGADLPLLVTGDIIDPDTIYNLRISPVRNAMRHLKLLFSQYVNAILGQLYFMDGKGNINATSNMSQAECAMEIDAIHHENGSLILALTGDISGNTPIYKPETVSFKYPMSMDDFNVLKTNMYGKIGYSTDDTVQGYGWLLNLEYSPNGGLADFTLLNER